MVRKLDSGGLERDVAKLALGLDRTRFTPHVAVFEAGGMRWDEVAEAGVDRIDLKVSSLASPAILGSLRALSGFVLRKRIRVLHAYDTTAVLGVPLARVLRVPVVLSTTVGSRELLDQKSKKHVRFTDPFVDGILVNCEAMRRHLMDDFGIAPERIELCYNGVETSEFYPGPGVRPAPLANASAIIGTVCVLRWEKRLEVLIEAFAAAREAHPGAKLLIVGSGPELPKLEAKAAECGVTADCLFHPVTREVAPLLRAMDIFVSCSVSEAFSNSVLEAMACGCCPVGSRVGGTPELIEDGERGLLFEVDNTRELAAKLKLLLNDAELRGRFARNAADFAAHKLNMQVALDRMGEIYSKKLKQKGAAG